MPSPKPSQSFMIESIVQLVTTYGRWGPYVAV